MTEKDEPVDIFDKLTPHYSDFYPPDTRANLEFRCSRKLILTSRRWVGLIDAALKAATGQNRARWQTLFAIAFAEPPVTTVSLSARLSVRWPTLVRTLAMLERDKLVRRSPNPQDGRSRLLALTDEGRNMLHRIQPIIDKVRHDVLGHLSEAQLIEMTALLDATLERILRVSAGLTGRPGRLEDGPALNRTT